MRGMPSVVTERTCVSPRWNRPVPWAVLSRPTWADSGRMSVVPRPSIRKPSFTMRDRTTSFWSDRSARFTGVASNLPGSSAVPARAMTTSALMASIRALRSDLSAMDIASEIASRAAASTAA